MEKIATHKARRITGGQTGRTRRYAERERPAVAGLVMGEAPALYVVERTDLVTLAEAASLTGKSVHNLRDYIQRGRITKFDCQGNVISGAARGELRVSMKELRAFLYLLEQRDEKHHHAGLNAELGFYDVPEHQRTRHVHRLHPYLGKFIPQLVEWFLRRHFRPGDWILDPFMGSGTTLVQANELGMASVGIDISEFNSLIARVKLDKYDLPRARREVLEIESRVQCFSNRLVQQEDPTLELFPEERMDALKASLMAACESNYLRDWFAPRALLEMLYYKRLIPQYHYQDLLRIILSRAARSSRLTTHYDLASPRAPIPAGKPYWCKKHKRMCVPIDNCIEKIHAYSEDTVRRLETFDALRTEQPAIVVTGDSRNIDLSRVLPRGVMFDGVFTSPPYVGQIDYHDQHRYAYELFGITRRDALEIGPKRGGKSRQARDAYVADIAAVFAHCSKYLKRNAKVFIVANDRMGLYPAIAERSGLRIRDTITRAVTKRTEQGDDPYQETIFFCVKAQ